MSDLVARGKQCVEIEPTVDEARASDRLVVAGDAADDHMLTTFSSNDRLDVRDVLIATGTPNQLNSLAEFVASAGSI